MPAVMPMEVRVEGAGDNVAYHLPVRPLGKLRLLGLVPVVFSIVFVSGPFEVLSGFLHRSMSSGKMDYLFLAFMVPFIIAGLAPLTFGILLMFGRCRIEWRQKRLTVTDHAGPFRWRRRLSKASASIRKLQVGQGTKVNGKPVVTGPLATMAILSAEFDQGPNRLVAMGYPRNWLQAIADDLSSRIKIAAPMQEAPKVEVIAPGDEDRPDYVVEKPASSLVRLETTPGGATLVVPPAGLGKGTKGLFAFAIMWCGFMTVFTAFVTFGSIKSKSGDILPFLLFIAGFWMIGLGLMAGAINMGRRRAMMLATGGALRVAQESIFGKKRWDWPAGEVADVRIGPSGMEVNDRPIIELQVHPVTGKKKGFFAGRDEAELKWMAFELRRALQLLPNPEAKTIGDAAKKDADEL